MAGGISVNKRQRELLRKEKQAEKATRRDERRIKRNSPEEIEPAPELAPELVPAEGTEANPPAAESKITE
jgi:hypothetical protein